MERLKMMKENLIACVQAQLSNLQEADTKELGEAIDMIKDLEESMYYCSIVKAMEDSEKEKEAMRYTYPPVMYDDGMMYYGGGRSGGRMNYPGGRGGRMYYQDDRMYPSYSMNSEYPRSFRDYREGRSPINRRTYMESKEMHKDPATQKHELEKYLNELSNDVMEMIIEATPEERTMLSQKLSTLAEKVTQ